MRFLSIILCVTLVAWPMPAVAQDTAAPDAQLQLPATGDILPLRRGQAAPQDGLLIDAHDLLDIQQSYERMRFLLGLTHDRDVQLGDVRVQMEQARTRAAEERLTLHDTLWADRQAELVASLQAAQQQAQHAAERQWFESPILWAAIGAVLATVVYISVTVR